MQRMACCIQRALLKIDILSIVYLDDLLIICKRNQEPENQFGKVLSMVRRIGLPIALENVVGPARNIRFLGIINDVDNREIRMPQEKIQRFLQLIQDIYDKRSIKTHNAEPAGICKSSRKGSACGAPLHQ